MINYHELSNFEMNKMVAEKLKLEFEITQVFPNPAPENKMDYNAIRLPERCNGHIKSKLYDPCNNPSHAWKIIFENKISVYWNGGVYDSWKARTVHTYVVEHENPLRAAMTVFLMMKVAA